MGGIASSCVVFDYADTDDDPLTLPLIEKADHLGEELLEERWHGGRVGRDDGRLIFRELNAFEEKSKFVLD